MKGLDVGEHNEVNQGAATDGESGAHPAPDTAIDFLYLSEPDMIRAGVTDMAACVETMTDMLALFAKGDYRMAGAENNSHGAQLFFPKEELFPGMPVDGPDRRFMAMPAYLGGDYQMAGCKWYGSNVENKQRGLPRSILMFSLNDKDTGAPLAHMSANLLSAYRTGAIPGVGARFLAREDAREVGIVGPGPMNRTSLEAFLAVRPNIDTVKVAGRSQRGIDTFITWAREKFPQIATIKQVDGMEEAVRDSDIVSIAVPSPSGSANYPHVRDEWVKPGAFICCSAHLALDESLTVRSRHVADARKIYQAWAEEIPAPAHEIVGIWGMHIVDRVRDGRMTPEQFEDLGEIIGGAPGRQHNDEIFIYSVGGMPVEDVAWATHVYRNAIRDGIGTKLKLWDAPALA